MLEKNWKVIREEGLANMDLKSGTFVPEEENLRDTGEWHQFTLYQRGRLALGCIFYISVIVLSFLLCLLNPVTGLDLKLCPAVRER